jgi:uncharacterized protein GlcG (DUF336 family)
MPSVGGLTLPAIARASRVTLGKHAKILIATFVSLGLSSGTTTAQDLLMDKTLPLALAVEAAQTALATCMEQGYRVSVAVVDRAGLVRALIRADGAGPHTLDSSSRKAYTSSSLRLSTMELGKMVSQSPAIAGLRDMNEQILILGGGLPIKAGEDVVGGIGVGGAPGGEKDEACAQAGIDKIKARLK